MSAVPTVQPTFKEFVRCASTANIANLSSPGTIDAITLAAGDRVLLKDQSTASQNGIYYWTGATLSRPTDASILNVLTPGHTVYVAEGTANGASEFSCTTTGLLSPGSTSLAYKRTDGAWDEWETLYVANAIMVSSGVVGTYVLKVDGTVAVVSTGALTGASSVFPLDPAQYSVTGKTIQCRVVGHVLTLNTAPLSTMNFSLVPISSVSSTQIPTLGAASGSSGTIAAPAINTMTSVYGSAFTMPAAGTYCLACVTTTATNAATQQHLRATLQVRAN